MGKVLREVPGYAGSGNPQLSALRISDPEKFKKIIRVALKLNHGNILNAAAAMKVHRNTLMVWLNKYPELRDAITENQ